MNEILGANSMALGSRPLESFRIERELLKDRAMVVLRDAIIGGSIAPGSRLVEREVAEKLGTSRVPARDALMALEREGLLVSRGGARYVIDVSQEEIKELYAVRVALETLAVELACDQKDRGDCGRLYEQVEAMERAIAADDEVEYRKSDFRFHKETWALAGNRLLTRLMEMVMGGICTLIVRSSRVTGTWSRTADLHRAVADGIREGAKEVAVAAIHRHLEELYSCCLEETTGGDGGRNGGGDGGGMDGD